MKETGQGLVSLFNGISTFVGYLLTKNSSDTLLTHSWRDKGFIPFLKVLAQKELNSAAGLELLTMMSQSSTLATMPCGLFRSRSNIKCKTTLLLTQYTGKNACNGIWGDVL